MKLFRYLAVGALTLSVSACDSLLDTSPKQSLAPDQFLNSIPSFQYLVASAYNRLQSTAIHGQRLSLVPDILADNVTATGASGRLRNEYLNQIGTGVGGWGTYYGLVSDANLVLTRIGSLTPATASEAATRVQLKGESFFLRAYAYHNLARIYGPEPGHEALRRTDLSVPLRLTATLGEEDATFLPRATVTEVYAQMRKDLDSATVLLTAAGVNNKFRATKVAAKALRARVELYAGQWAAAESYATAAMADSSFLASGGARLAQGNTIVVSYTHLTLPTICSV